MIGLRWLRRVLRGGPREEGPVIEPVAFAPASPAPPTARVVVPDHVWGESGTRLGARYHASPYGDDEAGVWFRW